MGLEQPKVVLVGFEADVENVTKKGDGPEEGIEQDHADHAEDERGRGPVTHRYEDDVGGHACSYRVADPGNEPKEPIQADPPRRSRDAHRLVHEARQAPDPAPVVVLTCHDTECMQGPCSPPEG